MLHKLKRRLRPGVWFLVVVTCAMVVCGCTGGVQRDTYYQSLEMEMRSKIPAGTAYHEAIEYLDQRELEWTYNEKYHRLNVYVEDPYAFLFDVWDLQIAIYIDSQDNIESMNFNRIYKSI